MSKESLTNSMLKESHEFVKQVIPSDIENQFHVSVSGSQKQLCVGIVDIVNSTKTVAKLPQNKYSNYYEIFLNHIGNIIYQYDGKILKTLGDGILFYFPETNSNKIFSFLDCIESGFSMIDSHSQLKQTLVSEFLPPIDFRISLDYGQVTMMKTSDWILDLLGPTINVCAKINHACKSNSMVIGHELFQHVKSIPEYKFEKAGTTSLGLKFDYQIYAVTRNSDFFASK